MLGGLDIIVALAGMILPPAVDFVKKKFLNGKQDTPEATLSTLATTKPEVMPAYLTAQAGLMEATVKYFNRDICGTPSQWVVDLRASIRPIGVVLAFAVLVLMAVLSITSSDIVDLDSSIDKMLTGTRYSCELMVSSWFGDRITIGKG
jgi:hypothetical protein